MYYYFLGCGIACLIFCGIACMDTVDVKLGKILLNSLLWPVALAAALLDRSSLLEGRNIGSFHHGRMKAAR